METNLLPRFLPLILTVNLLVSVESTSIAFPPKVLSADLAAIAKNFEKDYKTMACLRWRKKYPDEQAIEEDDGFPNAYINWPKSITFRVRLIREKDWTWEQQYLKIEGAFQYRKFKMATHSYDGLYYQRGKFYVKVSDVEAMQPIEPDEDIFYLQPRIAETTPFVSIRYCGLKEGTEQIKSLHEGNLQFEDQVDTQYCNLPFPCSITLPKAEGDEVLEFTYWCENKVPMKGKVKVLIGDERKVSDFVVRSELVFDYGLTFPALTVREDRDRDIIMRNVFGVRTSIEGFDDDYDT